MLLAYPVIIGYGILNIEKLHRIYLFKKLASDSISILLFKKPIDKKNICLNDMQSKTAE